MSFLKTLIGSFLMAVLPAYTSATAQAQTLDLTQAVLVISPTIPSPMRETAPQLLREEVAKRSGITWKTSALRPAKGVCILFALAQDALVLERPLQNPNGPETQPEGFRVVSQPTPHGTTLWIIGADARGILFGTGWLLRQLDVGPKRITLPTAVHHASAPAYPIRGHQLGYRTTANSYDAWTVAQFDQYIRELAVFGTNAIEGIPFHEDEKPSPHFTIPPTQMRIELGRICQKYDLDYWVWTPVTVALANTNKRQAELDLHESFYKATPRLNHVFVPGGDPGDNHPSEVMPFLKDLHDRLIKYHPKANIWLSLQGFSVAQTDYFYRYLAEHKPQWLAGVVHGPGSPSLSETRFRLPAPYQIRQYPDITHNVRCDYPVADWDQAYALTLGREASNPRPTFFANAHAQSAPFTQGFVSYSDGCHDDINKVVWSMRGYEPDKPVHEILQEYSRFFFGNALAEAAANGIEALEQNWHGSLAANGGVEATFGFWQNLEQKNPNLQLNWRWQLLLLRAYYDTYTRRRLLYEQALEQQANALLLKPQTSTPKQVMQEALALVNQADTKRIAPGVRKRIDDLCEALYQSIGLQTSVPRYQANGYERGCLLDFVDYPLNNRWWLADAFAKTDSLPNDTDKWERLKAIATWEKPGNGSYYDDISNTAKSPHVKTVSDDATDIAWWNNGFSRARLSSQTFQRCPTLEYTHLDPGGQYKLRVAGYGEALLRVDGFRIDPIQYERDADTYKEWLVPVEATRDGRLTVTFDQPEESHLNWRKNSRISDVWLIKTPTER